MKRSITLATLDTTAPLTDRGEKMVIEVTLSYGMGGMNYFTGTSEGRGYYLHVTPVKIGNGFKSFTAFSGTKSLIEETKRFSDKRLGELAATALTLETYPRLLDSVLSRNALTLTTEAA
jgi:hypothetical protein